MFDIIKKSVLAGIGMMAITEEKMQGVIDEFVEKGKLTQKEGECLLDEVQKAVRENRQRVSTMIDERVQTIMNELHVLTKEDLKATETSLKEELANIAKRLEKIEEQTKA